jgi:serine/threonine protein kinase/Tfp pilus assembly protein PilF
MNEETLFHQALALSPAQRASYLKTTCAGKPELLAAVEALLAAHEAAENILDRAPTDTAVIIDAPLIRTDHENHVDNSRDLTPTSIRCATTMEFPGKFEVNSLIADRYVIEEKIGEGGMGEVWVAKQTEPVRRKVALKLIKPGMDSRIVLARFEQERQALAMMDHPNIAKVYDAGLTPIGQPFFAMELVNGLPLTTFCDTAKLTPRERLQLFVPICQAVQHAHQKGIIHRDLKPANILVTMIDGKPVPKVIDFGVAKATAGKLTNESLSTQFGMVIGTLEYLSPEQAGLSTNDVDTRADIYSLGVVLYELLTGLRPLSDKRLKKAALAESIRVIREEEPVKPSTRLLTHKSLPSLAALRQIEPRRLMTMLRGELDWVVMKCLEKERDRRYETATGLARDIERFLASETVEARPPSTAYRLKKYIHRNQRLVVATAVLLLAVLAGLAGTTWGLVRARRANVRLADEQASVQARFELAQRAISTFHTGVSEDALLKNEQFKELRVKLLRQAASFYGDLEALLQAQSDPKSQKLLADGYFQLGELSEKIGSNADTLAAHQKALAIRRQLAAQPQAELETQLNVAHSMRMVGRCMEDAGETAGALWAYQEVIRIATALKAESTADAVQVVLAQGYNNMAKVLALTGKPTEALVAYETARDIRQRLVDTNPTSTQFQRDLAQSYHNVGYTLAESGKPELALAAFEKGRNTRQDLLGANPAVVDLQADLAVSHFYIGWILWRMGRPSEALTAYEKARRIQQELVDAKPAVNEYQSQLAASYNNIGTVLLATGERATALAAWEQSRDIRQTLADSNPRVAGFQFNLAQSYNNFGCFLCQSGKLDEALAAHKRARDIRRKLVDTNPKITQFQVDLAHSYNNIGETLSQLRKPAKALIAYEEALTIIRKLSDAYPTTTVYQHELARIYNNLGDLHTRQQQFTESFNALDMALAIGQKLRYTNPTIADYTESLGYTYACRGRCSLRAGQALCAGGDLRRALVLWAKLDAPLTETRFERARVFALLAELGANGQSAVAPVETEKLSNQAVAALREAISAGWSQPNQLGDPEFNAMRARDDFRKCVVEIQPAVTSPNDAQRPGETSNSPH